MVYVGQKHSLFYNSSKIYERRANKSIKYLFFENGPINFDCCKMWIIYKVIAQV